MEEKPEPIERVRSLFDKLSPYFDIWVEMLQGRVYGYVTWEHLKRYLPKDKDALILDAGGGTGRWALPLAKMGYRVILCDISKGMLEQAENKIKQEGLSDVVKIKEEDLTDLSFPEDMFDFVLCEDGPISISDSEKALTELRRVLKKEGKIWASVIGRYALALDRLKENPEKAHKLINRDISLASYKGLKNNRIFTPQEIRDLFEKTDIKIINIYGNRIVTRFLSEEIQNMTDYDDNFFSQIVEIELSLSTETSLLGMAEYLQIIGEKIDSE